MDFYTGKVSRVDLSAGAATVGPVGLDRAERCTGGKDALLRYMWEHTLSRGWRWGRRSR